MKKLISAGLMVLFCGSWLFAVPQSINFQGRILEEGEPFSGVRDIVFSFYDTEEDGEPLAGCGPMKS
jgi:hypothetical protein